MFNPETSPKLCKNCPIVEARRCAVHSLGQILNGKAPIVSLLNCGDTEYTDYLKDRIAHEQVWREKMREIANINP